MNRWRVHCRHSDSDHVVYSRRSDWTELSVSSAFFFLPPLEEFVDGLLVFKSEPHTWSWQQQVAKAPQAEQWDGVRNAQAKNNMAAMKVGELGFFYHSGKDKEIVGIVKVAAPFHPDTTDETGRYGCVDVVAVASMPSPITLAAVKADPRFADMVLVRNSRLSVQPVTDEQWRALCEMGGYCEPQ